MNPFISKRHAISRRRFLQGTGIALALPFLDNMAPCGRAEQSAPRSAAPRRLFAICNNLGLLPEHFFPKGAGLDYTPSPYLQFLQEHRRDFTVFSGVSHPNVDGGHPSDISFLTAAPHPASSSFRNTISIDQYIAERIGTLTRFPSITLAVNGGRGLSWTGTGVAIPAEQSASAVFRQLFLQGTAEEIEAQIREIDTGRSILDAVADQAKDLQRKVGASDRDRLDQYFTSVRDLENRLQASRGWENKPKPVVKAAEPVDPSSPAQYLAKVKLMYDLARLAFETDSTRAITLMLNSVGTPVLQIQGETITDSYHNLSHHGKAPEKLTQLKVVDEWHMKLLAGLFDDLKSVREHGEPLLDRTMIFYGSNLGDANAHSTANMPTIFAGGGFRHGQHVAFDTQQNYPLPNLFVTMLQRMGIETNNFASATGTMRGLEMT
jgi:BMFP domain-containing protein YqiC